MENEENPDGNLPEEINSSPNLGLTNTTLNLLDSRPYTRYRYRNHNDDHTDASELSKEDDENIKYGNRNKTTPRSSRLNQFKKYHWGIAACLPLLCAIFSIIYLALIITNYFNIKEAKLCDGITMMPNYKRLLLNNDYSRLAAKYNLYLYREVDYDHSSVPNGIPVLFIPGNAGSFRQGRSLAAEAARQYYEIYANPEMDSRINKEASNMDFYLADFNNDLTAFHGQTMLDQAEYLNDAIKFIFSLYNATRSSDFDKPKPKSVIIVSHSMGGMVARLMVTLPNYIPNSINTMVSLSTPHSVAPLTFDMEIDRIYSTVNKYWRESFEKLQNPLSDISLISVAGGKLDSTLPSDYTGVSSIIPPSNGFTVYTTGIPRVWTAVDHLAIVWCGQLRTVIVKALMEITNSNSAYKTKPLKRRMEVFKKHFISEFQVSSTLASYTPTDDPSETYINNQIQYDTYLQGSEISGTSSEKIVITHKTKQKSCFISIPRNAEPGTKFSLISNNRLGSSRGDLVVLLCSDTKSLSTSRPDLRLMTINQHGIFNTDEFQPNSLLCRNVESDVIITPSSYNNSREIDTQGDPFYTLQYEVNKISDYNTIFIGDSSVENESFTIAEITDKYHNSFVMDQQSIYSSAELVTNAQSSTIIDVQITALSSLFVYDIEIRPNVCVNSESLFSPFIRQYIKDPYETKYHINFFKDPRREIFFHGIVPFAPFNNSEQSDNSLHLQIFADSPCSESKVEIKVKINALRSLGLLVMRYRTAFASFPIAIVSIVLLIQFDTYSTTGDFIGFYESICILCFNFLGPILIVLSGASFLLKTSFIKSLLLFTNLDSASHSGIKVNTLFLGLEETDSLWFLGPLFFITSIGSCIILYGAVYLLEHLVSSLLLIILPQPAIRRLLAFGENDNKNMFRNRRKLATSAILLVAVLSYVPYQFVYVILCGVQIINCLRIFMVVKSNEKLEIGGEHDFQERVKTNSVHRNLFNFMLSILIAMIWILPINSPVLIIWIQNIAVQWSTPFGSHHNILSILPILLLVEKLSCGSMIPRISSSIQRSVTFVYLLYFAFYSLVYGIQKTYGIHHLFNIFAAWLFYIYI